MTSPPLEATQTAISSIFVSVLAPGHLTKAGQIILSLSVKEVKGQSHCSERSIRTITEGRPSSEAYSRRLPIKRVSTSPYGLCKIFGTKSLLNSVFHSNGLELPLWYPPKPHIRLPESADQTRTPRVT